MKITRATTPRRAKGITLLAAVGAFALLTSACAEGAPETVAVGAPGESEGAVGAGGEGEGGGGEGESEPPSSGGEEGESEPPSSGGGEVGIQMHEFCVQIAETDLQDLAGLRQVRDDAPDELQDAFDVLVEQAELLEEDPLSVDFDAFTEATTEVTDWEFDNCLIIE